MTNTFTPNQVSAGQNIANTILVTNNGPDTSVSPVLTFVVPANTTFQGIIVPAGWTCTTPPVGGTGTVRCTASSLGSRASADFSVKLKVESSAPTEIVISTTASVSSNTHDPNLNNNSAPASAIKGVPTLPRTGVVDQWVGYLTGMIIVLVVLGALLWAGQRKVRYH